MLISFSEAVCPYELIYNTPLNYNKEDTSLHSNLY